MKPPALYALYMPMLTVTESAIAHRIHSLQSANYAAQSAFAPRS